MNEAEWLACTDPWVMLQFLRGKASNRKLRLFGVACCWRIWDLLTEQRHRTAVEVAERFADGKATLAELDAAWPWKVEGLTSAEWAARDLTRRVRGVQESVEGVAENAAEAREWVAENVHHLPGTGRTSEDHAQAHLLRDIFNPWAPALALSVLTWQGGTVPKLARAIYDARDFDRLPILADALEEAGCTDPAILSHCRQPGEHVRGCWAVDAILGKS